MKKLNKISGQFSRFIVVGLLSTLVNYAVFYFLLTSLGVHYQWASAIGFMAGVGVGYPLNKAWTYGHHQQISVRRKLGYGAVYLASLALSLAFLALVVDIGGVDARLANVLAIGITTCTNFIGTKFLVFRT